MPQQPGRFSTTVRARNQLQQGIGAAVPTSAFVA